MNLALLDRGTRRELLVDAVEPVLAAYGLEDARVYLLEQKTNITFRIEAGGERFLLRVCQAGAYDPQELASEGMWLRALRESGLVVPELVAARDGSPVASVLLPGHAEPRWCVLSRWVPGQIVQLAVDPAILEQVGELGGRIHNVSEAFAPPSGFTRPRWDCDRLFGQGEVIPAGRGEPLITRRTREILAAAAVLLRQDMASLGEGPDVWGLIHKDLEPDNTVIHEGLVHAIDFADCGWGHYLYDIAASLLPLREKKGYPELRAAFLRGYRRYRPLRPEHEALIDTFLIARSLFTIRFMVLTSLDVRPELQSYAERVIPMMVGEIRRFVEKRAGGAPRGGKATVVQLLAGLRDRGVKLWVEGEKLRFTAPQGALTPELKADLAERKAEVLAFLRQGQAAPVAGPVPRVLPAGAPVPLSFAQQRLWFLDQLHPGSPEYNIARAVRLTGDLRAGILARSLNEVIRRHEALRTRFTVVGREPAQVVDSSLVLELPVVDLGALPEEGRLAEARRLIDREARRSFDLARGPLARVWLLRLAEDKHVAASTMHHIISDGWSTGLLFREMGLLYESFLAGRPSPLPELPVQYPDFALWQREHLQGEVLAGQLAWWRDQLADVPDLLELPADRPRSAVRDSRSGKATIEISRELSGRLRDLGQAEGATLFMVLFAAWNALLARASGQEDIVLGIPIANRNRSEVEGLIGFFVNTLALRTRLAGDPSWRELLGRVRQTTLGAYARQDLPFETLVAELRPDRALAGNPLFQVMFALQTAAREESLSLPSLTMSPSPLSASGGPAKFDLTLSLVEGESGVRGSLEYRAELFDAPTIVRLLEHFRVLLEGAAAGPDRRLSELPLLAEAERHQVLIGWNDTAGPDPAHCLHDLFAERARRHPEALAVSAADGDLTYGELRSRAGRLARRLHALGVGPEVAVGLCLERSASMVTAVLAILEAGGAYVPLALSYPAERLRQMAEDAGLHLVLTGAKTADRLPELPGVERFVRVDRLEEEAAESAAPGPVTADNLAYVMFTSGSTGRPKGVAVTHRAVARLVLAANYARLGSGEVFLQYAPLSFDASTLEIWGCLLNGGRLVVPPEGRLSLEELGRIIVDQGVTTLWLTAGLFHQMVEEHPEGLGSVRQLLAGGDVLSPPHVRRLLAERPGLTLINGYGPTENTTFTCCHPMPEPERAESPVPIGRPITGTRAVLLDRWLAPVPVGVAGELYAAGHGLARGYARRPDLTAERFVPHPYPSEPGERLYRTGDLARFRPDGAIEFLGRRDHQVKIRGFRIELAEIELALARQPGVREAVVLVREDAPGDKRLVACVAADAAVDTGGLQAALRAELPDYMVPAAFVRVGAFPLGPTGKVDRRALARIEPASGPRPQEVSAAPRDPVEELLAGLWAEVLRVERVGRDDDFFASGGHSLLATQVVSRVREAFRIELPLQLLFELPTVAGLAPAIRERLREGGSLEAPPIVPVPRGGYLPLSFAQQRLWFLDRFEPGSAAYNIPVAVRLDGRLVPALLARAVREVARRHEALRTTFAESDGQPVQVVSPEPRLDLPLVDLDGLSRAEGEREARRLAAAEARRPFDLAAGPLLRTALLRLGETQHMALVTFHHIVADGWSMGLFLEELAALYGAFSRAEPSPLPELPVQYADFALWQRSWLAGEVLRAELDHWRRRLAGAPRSLELPTDRPRPAAQTYRGRSLPLALAPDLAGAVARLGAREGVTPFMTLLAAFQVLMGRLARTEDVVVGAPIAGRNRRETEGLIGFFVNTLVLRTSLGGDPTVSELLGRVRQVALSGYAHQDIPFERLVEELQPERDLSFHPLFQVVFVLQNASRGSFELPALTLTPLAAEGETAKFDLTLSLQETTAGLQGSLEHNTDLFDGATLERWLGSFQVLLEGMVEAPGRLLSELPWLAEAERRQVVVGWNATGSTGPADLCLHELFEAQVERTPGALAVVRHGEGLTYRELDRRAGGIARRLRELGVAPEERVGVCLERSLDLVAALLGVLKAGGAYVPLDPAYPLERLAFMVEDAGARLVLTERALLDRLPAAAQPIFLEPGAELPDSGDAAVPERPAAPGFLAYLIYTSGSTGRPKGVAVEHRNAVALARWARELFPAEELAGVLASTSVCFDLSVFELFVPLAWGGRVILAENALELPAIAAAGADVRLINTVPSVMAELVREDALPASVRTVNLAGEPLPGVLAERIYQRRTVGRVLNLYGPSEDTTYSTFALVGRESGEPTIGRPITGSRAYVLDATSRPVPAGVPGELYLGGEGLARGYLGRPDRTAMSFVPDPFGGEPGARLYRTGDLVRFLPGGDLQFLGRIDHQVKIRGFRIELGEIEAALGRHPGVRKAAVVVREDQPGNKRLVACMVAEGLPAPTSGDLRETLRQWLPDYMLPSALVFLEALPLNPNGKVDRRALARLASEPLASERTGGAPASDPVEELLAAIWAEVLHRDEVGREENFFIIGGHSLLATQVISRVREAFRVELPLQRLFDTPTVKGLAEVVRKHLLSASGAVAPPVVPVPRAGGLPLSFAQERLWFLDQLQPGSAAYNVPAAVRLLGDLDVPALAAAAREVVQRHESLRTTFEDRGGEPVQVIAPELPLAVPLADLSGLPEEAREAEARHLASAEARRPFDLQAGPLVRVCLLRLGEREHAALVVFHHIVSDGWSMGVFLGELAELYRGSPLPPLPVQYADFIHWQRRWLAGEVLEAELASWRERLAGAPRTLELPTDRPRPAVPALRGRQLAVAVPPELNEGLVRLGRREGVTPFMTLLALFQALLGRLTGSEEVPVGTPIAGRNRREIEGLIGFFVNTLVLSTDLSGGPDVRELLRRAREVSLHGYTHQDLPFERLVEELQPERDLSRNPLFQVMFALQNAPFTALDLPALRLEPLEAKSSTAKFDLTLSLGEQGSGLGGVLEYDAALFDPVTPERWWRSFQVMLAAAAKDPEGRIANLPLLDTGESHQLLMEWNDGGVVARRDLVLPVLLAAQAARTPEAVALVCGEERVSYAGLERSADRLAHALRRLGVGPEVVVALQLERGVELVTGMLATLKSGGAYLPLDPALPAERRKFLLADSRTRVVLTRDPTTVNVGGPVAVLGLEPGWEEGLPAPKGPLADDLLPSHSAYVIYTSGSTGQPKGVAIPHSALVNHMLWMQESLPLSCEDRVLQKTPAHFDASVWEIWAPLLAGAQLVLARPEGHRDPDYLVAAMREHGITVLQVVPTLLRALLEEEGLAECRTLRRLCVGGEAMTAELRDGFFALGLGAELVNLYGPTEATIDAAWARVGPVEEGAVPIGRPISNTRVWLLDAWGEPVPAGVAGHLHLGGACLGRGYVGRPDLTAASYVPDPFGLAGSRLYRTGDLARWQPDGSLEYLGRLDHQVKIRGFRIELGEIEAALCRLPQVREAVVLVRELAPGDERLVACVVAPPEGPSAAELRAGLRETLPDAMVPSSFIRLDKLPLRSSGKVDRRAVACLALDPDGMGGVGERLAPRDALELQLATLWEELLHTGPVGVRDDFFSLGGHSLLAVRLVARLRERLGRTVPLTAFLQRPTVEGLAAELRREGGEEGRRALVPIRPEGDLAPLFLVHPIGGNVLCYGELARHLGPRQPLYGLQVPDPAAATVEEMAARYLEAARGVQPPGHAWRLGGWSMGGVIAFEMAWQLDAAGEEVALLAVIDGYPRGAGPSPENPSSESLEEAGEQVLARLFARDLEGLLGAPPELGDAGLRPFFEMFRDNARALQGYEPRPYPGRAVLFRASAWAGAAAADPTLGWSRLALGGVEVRELAGTHYTLLQGERAAELAARLCEEAP